MIDKKMEQKAANVITPGQYVRCDAIECDVFVERCIFDGSIFRYEISYWLNGEWQVACVPGAELSPPQNGGA